MHQCRVYVKMVNKVTKEPTICTSGWSKSSMHGMSVFTFLWISNENDQPFPLRLAVELSCFEDSHLQLRSNGMTCLGP